LGLTKQVIFDRSITNPFPYFESADIVLITDPSLTADEVVLKAAAAGAPLVVVDTPTRRDYFPAGSAVLTVPTEAAVGEGIRQLVERGPSRLAIGRAGRLRVETIVPSGRAEFQTAYRQLIDAGLSITPH
jgi:glycosyltransferase involved in cell wall biosynthesis